MYTYNFYFAGVVLTYAGRMGETMAPSKHSGRGAAGLGSRVEVAETRGKLCVARRAGCVLLTLGITHVFVFEGAVLTSAGRMGETMAPSKHSGRGVAGLGRGQNW